MDRASVSTARLRSGGLVAVGDRISKRRVRGRSVAGLIRAIEADELGRVVSVQVVTGPKRRMRIEWWGWDQLDVRRDTRG